LVQTFQFFPPTRLVRWLTLALTFLLFLALLARRFSSISIPLFMEDFLQHFFAFPCADFMSLLFLLLLFHLHFLLPLLLALLLTIFLLFLHRLLFLSRSLALFLLQCPLFIPFTDDQHSFLLFLQVLAIALQTFFI
jgi:hypothetical protein